MQAVTQMPPDRPKDIVFIAHFAGSLRHGMVFGHYYLAREWVKRGHRVTIVAAGWTHTRFRQPALNGRVSEESIDGIRYLWVKVPKYVAGGQIGRVLNLVSFAAQVWLLPLPIRDADLVICSSHCPFAIHGSAWLAHRTGARLVFEVRDLWPLTLVELGDVSPNHPLIRAMQWSEDFAYRRADRVVSVLPAAADYMMLHGMAPDKFVYVPNGIDVASTSPANPARIGLLEGLRADGRFLLGFAGRFVTASTIDYLLSAVSHSRLEDVHIVLIGDGYQRTKIETQAGTLGLADRVSFLGMVEKSEVVPLLAIMDALYLGLVRKPIFRFGVSPTKLNDYLLAARPVIYAVDAPEDVVSQTGCGISCPPEDVEAIADAIKRLHAAGPAERGRMGRAGREWLLANRSYPKLASDFLDAVFPHDA